MPSPNKNNAPIPSPTTLLTTLKKDYPKLNFQPDTIFRFHPPSTIYYALPKKPKNPTDHHAFALTLLHELGHYKIARTDYQIAIDLLKIEASAWEEAKKLCTHYHIPYDEDFAEDHLDTYRDWLHSASLCKTCQLSGYQDTSGAFHCPLCQKTWHSPHPR